MILQEVKSKIIGGIISIFIAMKIKYVYVEYIYFRMFNE